MLNSASCVRVYTLMFFLLIFNKSNAQLDDFFNSEWSKITYKVEVEPKFNIADTKTIIISEVVNPNNEENNHSYDIYDDMSNNITSIDGLTLIDRGKTEALLKEFKFQQSGLVDKKQIKKLGDFYGSGLLIFARIQTDNFGQSIETEKSLLNKNGCNIQKRMVGFYDLQINLKIIDLKTASIVLSQNLSASEKGKGPTYDCSTPADLDSNSLYQKARIEIGKKFKELFVLHTKEHTIDFQTSSKFNKDLKKAITLLEIDDFEAGYQMIKDMAAIEYKKDRTKSSAIYNLAMMQLFNEEFEESLANAKKAYMLNSKNKACLEIIEQLK
ncbi:hypothetical protein [Winogradskyella vincentii]|uniref:Tetratricopeptide repeat-containing protein n=1 Tax=Winogradskyella vincentii TaxID=2877122 RepID=A0ABS7Y2K3_9FLAO|nr:hypothetical protein [Winogradskyella vincentii]MCA0153072.1 hypothetical protein [Winogradskyella vincentii]